MSYEQSLLGGPRFLECWIGELPFLHVNVLLVFKSDRVLLFDMESSWKWGIQTYKLVKAYGRVVANNRTPWMCWLILTAHCICVCMSHRRMQSSVYNSHRVHSVLNYLCINVYEHIYNFIGIWKTIIHLDLIKFLYTFCFLIPNLFQVQIFSLWMRLIFLLPTKQEIPFQYQL